MNLLDAGAMYYYEKDIMNYEAIGEITWNAE